MLQVENAEWRLRSAEQHQMSRPVPSIRGSILDRDGVLLAQSREVVEVGLAPRELRRDENGFAAEASAALQSVLGLSPAEARRRTSSDDAWVVIPGRYPTTVRAGLEDIRGVYLGRGYERYRPHGDLVAGVLGGTLDGTGAGGVEESYDQILTGRPGEEMTLRDAQRRRAPRTRGAGPAARAGRKRVAHHRRGSAGNRPRGTPGSHRNDGVRGRGYPVDRSGYRRDPRRRSRSGRATRPVLAAINTANEPGSTLKPFTIAAILSNGVGRAGGSRRHRQRHLACRRPHPERRATPRPAR